jgi:hypothetical protein
MLQTLRFSGGFLMLLYGSTANSNKKSQILTKQIIFLFRFVIFYLFGFAVTNKLNLANPSKKKLKY